MKKNGPKIYDYTNHLKYLNDMVEFLKKETKVFSYRYFAKKSGFASQSTLKFFLQGKRRLSVDSIEKVCKGLRLNNQESEYFKNMVNFNQQTSNMQKDVHFQEMLKIQKRKKIRLISSDQYEYFSKWYHPTVRELVRCEGFHGDPKWISQRIFPMITPKEARESLELLERLRLIQKDSEGRYHQTDRAVATEREMFSMIARKFHYQMGSLAIETLDSIPTDRRDFSGVTFGLPSQKVQDLKDKINAFRKELTSTLGSLDEETDEVYHMNIQLFPLTKKEKK